MSKDLVVKEQFSEADLKLIKDTVAKGATDSELQLFLNRAKLLKLNPLKPGQIYFVKFYDNPGTIIVGLDGFRTMAARTGKHVGTRRGITRDGSSKAVTAWCEVYRSDWQKPAREEISIEEYFKPGKNGKPSNWDKMPETMGKKVAECAALRMAFPDDLGGVYGEDEREIIETAQRLTTRPLEVQVENLTDRPEFETVLEDVSLPPNMAPQEAGYIFKTGGQRKGKPVTSFPKERLEEFIAQVEGMVQPKPDVLQDYNAALEYLHGLEMKEDVK